MAPQSKLPDLQPFSEITWTNPQDYQFLISFLKEHADQEYKHFNERLIPGSENKTYGVRLSLLRPLAKKIARSDSWRAYLALPKKQIHEEVLLEGMVISIAKMPYSELLIYINSFVPKITNWALCDCFVSAQMLAKNKADFWPEIPRFLSSSNPWFHRFAFIVLMTYYLDDQYLLSTLDYIAQVHSEHYYVQMAQAWLMATAFTKQRDKTWKFLQQKLVSPVVLNMTIRKIRDSYRISPQDKDLVLTLK